VTASMWIIRINERSISMTLAISVNYQCNGSNMHNYLIQWKVENKALSDWTGHYKVIPSPQAQSPPIQTLENIAIDYQSFV
jgi:hypothetical protein